MPAKPNGHAAPMAPGDVGLYADVCKARGIRRLVIGDMVIEMGAPEAAPARAPTSEEIQERRKRELAYEESIQFAHVEGIPR